MYTVCIESNSGNEHEFLFDVAINSYMDEAYPGAKSEAVYDGMDFDECFILVNKKKRKINADKITCIDRDDIETAILAVIKKQNKD
jgi:hypothetical protein